MSVRRGATLGFDVFRTVECDGRPLDIRDIAEPPAGFDVAAFELQTVTAAVAVARRKLAGLPEQALHVALSEAFLASSDSVAAIVAMAREYPLIARGIIFCADARCFQPASTAHEALSHLAAVGFGLAAELKEGQPASAPAHSALRFVRVPAQRLLRSVAEPGLDVERDKIEIVATGVSEDREAMALLDLGIDAMVGERFSAPRRVRAERAAEARHKNLPS